jgi:hypothetical protein
VRGGPESAVGGPFDGNFAPAFLEAEGMSASSGGAGDWVEYLHGPLTFVCPKVEAPTAGEQIGGTR